jgi:hypothetical protein
MMLEQTIVMLCMILRQTSEKDRQDIPLLPGLLAQPGESPCAPATLPGLLSHLAVFVIFTDSGQEATVIYAGLPGPSFGL